MNVAVDARELAGRPTGVGRYLEALIGQWAASPDALRHEWRFLSHAPVAVPTAFRDNVSVLAGGRGTRWEQWTLPRALAADRPDVLFAPAYSAPLTAPCPVVVTIHDISFVAHPEWFSWREGMRRRSLTRWSARRARSVITDSMFSRNEIVAHLGIPSGKIKVITLGTGSTWRVGPERRDDHPREPVILYVGSIFRRRNVDALIAAFVNSVAHRVPGSRLEIVGENRTYPPTDPTRALESCPRDISARVTLRSYVDDATLRALYREASVFAFPSEYEGFGLTPLEALAAGVPPVVLDTPIAREVYGRAARFVPRNLAGSNALADALVELLTDGESRAAILTAADEVLQRYDWVETAAETLRVLEEAAGA